MVSPISHSGTIRAGGEGPVRARRPAPPSPLGVVGEPSLSKSNSEERPIGDVPRAVPPGVAFLWEVGPIRRSGLYPNSVAFKFGGLVVGYQESSGQLILLQPAVRSTKGEPLGGCSIARR